MPALPGRGSSQKQSQPWHLACQPPVRLCGCECLCAHLPGPCTHTYMHAAELWGLMSPSVPHSLAVSAGSPDLGRRPGSWSREEGIFPGALGGLAALAFYQSPEMPRSAREPLQAHPSVPPPRPSH